MITLAIAGCFVLAVVCAFFPATRFLTTYLVFTPLSTMMGGLASFVLTGLGAPSPNHVDQREVVTQMFFAGSGFGFAFGLAAAWWLNRKLRGLKT